MRGLFVQKLLKNLCHNYKSQCYFLNFPLKGCKNEQSKNQLVDLNFCKEQLGYEPIETLSVQEMQGIISFGVSLGTRMALGINIKAVFSSIAPEIIDVQSGKGIGWDIGFLYKVHRHLILGGVFENLNGLKSKCLHTKSVILSSLIFPVPKVLTSMETGSGIPME